MALDPQQQPRTVQVFFERRELDRLLALYGRMVAAGEWRDYGIGALADACVFSVFRRASEAPLYRIEKRPALARRSANSIRRRWMQTAFLRLPPDRCR